MLVIICFFIWVCPLCDNSLSYVLITYALFCIYVILQEKKFKTTATNRTDKVPENGTSLGDLKGEPSASLASCYSKAIHSTRYHNREQQKYR